MIVDITLSPASPVLAVQRSRCCEMFFISIRSSVMLIISPIHSSPNRVPRRSTQTLMILQRKTYVQPQHHHHLDPLHARCFKHSQLLSVFVQIGAQIQAKAKSGDFQACIQLRDDLREIQVSRPLVSPSPSIGALFPTQSLTYIHEIRNHS